MAKRGLPPLNTLRGFDAAARHLSFTLAAEELHVTQGAVSRQIRDLEGYFGKPLFRRLTRRIELTEAGDEFYATVREVFGELERSAARLRDVGQSRTLTISALPTIASMWLMPRLHLFTQANKQIDVRILSSIEPAELLAHDADVAIRVGRLPGHHYAPEQPRIELEMVRSWTGVSADELFPDRLVPVAAPTLIDRPLEVGALARILDHPLIHTSSRRYAWPDWLKAHGLRAPRSDRDRSDRDRLEFGHFFMSLEAARKGRGVAIIPDVVLAHYEGRDDLVTLRPASIESAGAYHLLVHESRRGNEGVMAFRRWILDEASANPPVLPS
jgi:LysR family glycine cleavage system transcriptional activator